MSVGELVLMLHVGCTNNFLSFSGARCNLHTFAYIRLGSGKYLVPETQLALIFKIV